MIIPTLPKNVTLLAATKKKTVEEIKDAISAGIQIIGENYVQEAEKKYEQLKGKVKFHCIGHLQTNKIKKAVEIFDMIQTVDSVKVAEEINKRCKDKIMPVLIEVNIGKEANKAGCLPEDVLDLAKEISKLKNIQLEGLMTMAPYFEDSEKVRPYFNRMKMLFDNVKKQGFNIQILSMGMSDSYKVAVEEGATMVRLGTVLFGPRT